MPQVISLRLLIPIALLTGLSSFSIAGCADNDDVNDGDEAYQAGRAPATVVLARVAITTLPGASKNTGTRAQFVNRGFRPGNDPAPRLSNSLLSSVRGAPSKPLFVGQDAGFDEILVAVRGRNGYFSVPAAGESLVGLDLVSSLRAREEAEVVFVATRTGNKISQVARVTLLVNDRVFLASGDLENHDTDGSNIADLFAPFLEGNQGDPSVPEQVLDAEDNNEDAQADGVKGAIGPLDTGHREVVWDGVPQKFVNRVDFPQDFFNRAADGAVGVRGGIVFAAVNGTGEEVNDAFEGVIPDVNAAPLADDADAPLGGDFSNINAKFAGNLLSFTQSAQFAPLGTTVTDITFTIPGTHDRAVVSGLGIVFSSVDKFGASSVEYFDERGRSIAKIVAPTQSSGPFPIPGPVDANKFPYSFVGFHDASKRIARVRVTAGDIPIDKASVDFPAGSRDVVAFDDVYYSEPRQ